MAKRSEEKSPTVRDVIWSVVQQAAGMLIMFGVLIYQQYRADPDPPRLVAMCGLMLAGVFACSAGIYLGLRRLRPRRR